MENVAKTVGSLHGGCEPLEENDPGCTKETEPRAAMQPGSRERTTFPGKMRREALQGQAAGSTCGIHPRLGKKGNTRCRNEKQHPMFLLCEPKDSGAGTSQTPSLSNIYVYSYIRMHTPTILVVKSAPVH